MATFTSSQSTSTNVPACFFFASHLNKGISGYEVCREIEKVVGVGKVIGAQFLHGLCRVYLATPDARTTLLMKGVTIGGTYISIIENNPHIVKGAGDRPAVKIIIGNLPLSISNDLIMSSLKQVPDISLRTHLFEEKYRDEKGGLTSFKTGRRFAYVNPPSKPLPKDFIVGEWRASLYHRGQKSDSSKTPHNNIVDPVSPQSDSVPCANNDAKQTQGSVSAGVSSAGTEYARSSKEVDREKGEKSVVSKDKPRSSSPQEKAISFIPLGRQGRPLHRGRSTTYSRSSSTAGRRKRSEDKDADEYESPRSKSRFGHKNDTTVHGGKSSTQIEIIDYFDYNSAVNSQDTS